MRQHQPNLCWTLVYRLSVAAAASASVAPEEEQKCRSITEIHSTIGRNERRREVHPCAHPMSDWSLFICEPFSSCPHCQQPPTFQRSWDLDGSALLLFLSCMHSFFQCNGTGFLRKPKPRNWKRSFKHTLKHARVKTDNPLTNPIFVHVLFSSFPAYFVNQRAYLSISGTFLLAWLSTFHTIKCIPLSLRFAPCVRHVLYTYCSP